MGAMHGITRLKCRHTAPPESGEFDSKFSRGQPEILEIVMRRRLQTFDTPPHIPWVLFVQQMIHAGVNQAGAVKNRLRFGSTIRLPYVLYVEYRKHYSFCIPQSDFAAAWLQRFSEGFGNIERDRHRPENAAGKLHIVADAFVVCLVHKAAQGRETSVQQQFKIADVAGRQVPRREVSRLRF